MLRTSLFVLLALAAAVLPARAQGAGSAPSGCSYKWTAVSQQAFAIASHYLLVRDVQVECNDTQLFADQAEVFTDSDRVRATGNVVFVTGGSRISADRMDYNTKTKTGTFFTASGIANIEDRGIDRSMFGTQEPDAFFWGETT